MLFVVMMLMLLGIVLIVDIFVGVKIGFGFVGLIFDIYFLCMMEILGVEFECWNGGWNDFGI